MPIYDRNESVYWVERGANRVWHDTSRHRKDDTTRIGPVEKAKEYRATLFLSADEQKQIMGYTPKLLTEGPVNPLDTPQDSALQYKSSVFVLPLPLIDIVIATSRLDRMGIDFWWYKSPIREQWARQQIEGARSLYQGSMFGAAAKISASCVGTLIPAVLCKEEAAEREADLFGEAWAILAMLVDVPYFLERWLGLAKEKVVDSKGTVIQSLVTSIMAKYNSPAWTRAMHHRFGPPELRMAETIIELEEEILKLTKSGDESGLTKTDRDRLRYLKGERLQHVREYEKMVHDEYIKTVTPGEVMIQNFHISQGRTT